MMSVLLSRSFFLSLQWRWLPPVALLPLAMVLDPSVVVMLLGRDVDWCPDTTPLGNRWRLGASKENVAMRVELETTFPLEGE